MNVRTELFECAQEGAKLSPRVEECMQKFAKEEVVKQYRDVFAASAKRAYEYIDTVIARLLEQWAFYKHAHILNPANVPSMSHDISDYEVLCLPTAHADFMPAWRKYCRTAMKKEFDSTHVAECWATMPVF